MRNPERLPTTSAYLDKQAGAVKRSSRTSGSRNFSASGLLDGRPMIHFPGLRVTRQVDVMPTSGVPLSSYPYLSC
jgi:hypothetical protein